MISYTPIDLNKLGDVRQLSDAELKLKLEQAGYQFQRRYQASPNYIHRQVADADVLISIGSNIADFNGYIELNKSAVTLWNALQSPCQLSELERALEIQFGIPHEQAAADVLEFMNLLLDHNMVTVQ